MKTIDELREAIAIMEIDDVHLAAAIVDELRGCYKDARLLVVARWLAKLREHYVMIGRGDY